MMIFCILTQGCQGQDKSEETVIKNIRPPAVSGKFYPDDPEKLRGAIDGYIKDAKDRWSFTSPPVALIAPHAGYIYSGQIAADAYKQVMEFDYDVVVILGTNHTTGGFNGISIYPEGAYRTVLGLTEINQDVTRQLIESDDICVFNPALHRTEHSVEVHVPFIQQLFPEAKIVPVVIGTEDIKACTRFGEKLAEILKPYKALIVASSDLSHYPEYDDAVDVDNKFLQSVIGMNLKKVKSTIREQMNRRIGNLSTCACGEGPILVAMAAAEAMGVEKATLISYANSGDALIGDYSRVVGYGAVVFGGKPTSTTPIDPDNMSPTGSLLPSDKVQLLNFARKTIHRYLTTETLPLPRNFSLSAQNKRGVFVTLNKQGQLRGCIGHMAEDMPLCRCVGMMALQSAFSDRRFPPVELEELDDIEIEISVLTPFELIPSADDIVIGRDGVVIKKGGRSAVYLPQVAPEQGWTVKETLDNLCRKAGLPKESWREGAELYIFQAEVFHEGEY